MDWVVPMFWPALLNLVGVTTAICAFLFWVIPRLERRFVFRPTREITQTPAQFGTPFEKCQVRTPDGECLEAWHLLPGRPRASVVYFHGNSGNLSLFAEVLAGFYRNRLQVFAFDYRGYGLSSGRPTESGLYVDALAASAYFLENLRADGCPVVFWGRSLGGPVAAYAARRSSPHGVVLETTFPSKRVLLRDYPWPYRFLSFFSRCRLDTLGHLQGAVFPKLVVHGDRDRRIPPAQGRYLFRSLDPPRSWLLIPGADHVNIHKAGEDQYWQRVLQFIGGL